MTNNKNLLNFFKKILNDKEKIKKLISYPDVDKMYEYAVSESDGGFTKEEFTDIAKKIIDLFSKILSDVKNTGKSPEEVIAKITDDALQDVSGGGDGEDEKKETPLRSIAMMAPSIATVIGTFVAFTTDTRKFNDLIKQREMIKPLTDMQQELAILNTKIEIAKAKQTLASLEEAKVANEKE